MPHHPWYRKHDDWCSPAETMRPASTDWFRRFLKQFCWRFGKKKVHAIDADRVGDWLDEVKTVPMGRRKNGEIAGYKKMRWSSSTTNSAVSCIKLAFNWAVASARQSQDVCCRRSSRRWCSAISGDCDPPE